MGTVNAQGQLVNLHLFFFDNSSLRQGLCAAIILSQGQYVRDLSCCSRLPVNGQVRLSTDHTGERQVPNSKGFLHSVFPRSCLEHFHRIQIW